MNKHKTLRALGSAAGLCALAACAGPDIAGGVLGSPDATRPIQVSPTRSVAVAFTASRSGQLSGVDLMTSRYQHDTVGLLAYLVTPNDPTGGDHPAAIAAGSGGEPGCWGDVINPSLTAGPRVVRVDGYNCSVQAGHTYWIQFATVAGSVNLYPIRTVRNLTIATRNGSTSSWVRTTKTGGLDVAANIRPVS